MDLSPTLDGGLRVLAPSQASSAGRSWKEELGEL